jgi:hypothetical protein
MRKLIGLNIKSTVITGENSMNNSDDSISSLLSLISCSMRIRIIIPAKPRINKTELIFFGIFRGFRGVVPVVSWSNRTSFNLESRIIGRKEVIKVKPTLMLMVNGTSKGGIANLVGIYAKSNVK